jgi:NADH:ubiquinone oxidoreductase subunit 4 (subunit M)
MINHGIYSGALFLLVGIIYERRHTRNVAEFGGLSHVMPGYAAGVSCDGNDSDRSAVVGRFYF